MASQTHMREAPHDAASELQELISQLPQEDQRRVEQLGASLAQQRRQLTLFRHPLLTLYYLAACASAAAWRGVKWCLKHPIMLFIIVPVLATYLTLKSTGKAEPLVTEAETWIMFVVWWVGLGVLSSVGLGTGIHTGLLFLFPHILKVCLAAEKCGHLDFDSRQEMWYRAEGFHCRDAPASSYVSFLDIYKKVAPAAVLWGAGTALGEIPPYAFSYHAAKAGIRNEEIDRMFGSQQAQGGRAGLIGGFVNGMKAWMMKFIQTVSASMKAAYRGVNNLFCQTPDISAGRHGFIGILVLAAWPNAAFDLCGICCGHFLMPFWEFFGATLVGKGLIKVNGQAAFFVGLFRKESRDMIMEWVEWALPTRIPGVSLQHTPAQHLHRFITHKISEFQESVARRAAARAADPRWFFQRMLDSFRSWEAFSGWAYSQLPSAWNCVVFLMIGHFVKDCIEQFAQAHAHHEHDAQLRSEALRLKRRQ